MAAMSKMSFSAEVCKALRGQDRGRVVRRQLAVGVVEDDLALPGVLDHPGLQVVRHDPGNRAREELKHRHVRPQPAVLLHVQRRLDKRVAGERQTPHEQIHPRGVAGDRIGQLHRRPRPVDLNALSSLVTDPRRRTRHQHVPLIRLAEPVITHRRLTPGSAAIDVLPVQQLQRHPHPRELAMNQFPVGLREHALVLTPAREQQRIHLSLGTLRDLVPADPCPVRGV